MEIKLGAAVKKAFFDTKAVMRAVDAATRRTLAQQGRYLQKVARSSIRKAPGETLAAMSTAERQSFHIRTEIAKREGTKPPKRRRVRKGSPPGTPPYSRSGLLKRLLYFSYDSSTRSAVVGPASAGPKTADKLEYGGSVKIRDGNRKRTIRIKPRPTMRLAYDKSKARLTDMWRNSVK